ncbi:hypothetical protein ABFO63_10455 [Acinetobacter junii]|uniref:hypothetical protein n=1 Tax=Acinetobacter TaxID=469 RepID=UPI003215A78B
MNDKINLHFLRKSSEITIENIGLAIIDNFTVGLGSSIKDSIQKIKEYSELSNQALYYLQIKTFLETIDLDDDEINSFFENNHDEQRLGIELFKILESTYLEKQAILLAINFKNYLKLKIDKRKFNRYINLIMKLDSHIFDLIDDDLNYPEKINEYKANTLTSLPTEIVEDDEKIYHEIIYPFESQKVSNSNELKILGLVEEELKDLNIKDVKNIKSKIKNIRTEFYLEFYLDLYRYLKN